VKQSLLITLVALIAFIIALVVWGVVLKSQPAGTIAHSVYQGGPLVVLLITILLMLISFVVERFFSLYKVAKGKSSVAIFFKQLVTLLRSDDFDGALAACDKQRGTTSNVLRAGI